MNYDFFSNYKRGWILLLFFGLLFIWRAYQGLFLAMDSSLDMQWYPAVQYWGFGEVKINPYIAYLNHDTFMSQGPNYTPMLYVLMYPFALMNFEWAKITFFILNIFCFLGTLWVFYRYKTSIIFLLLASIFVIFGYTFLNVLANAQMTIILGFLIAMAYVYQKRSLVLTLCLTLILVKHSFGIPILLGFFLAGYKKEAVLAGLIQFVFVVLFAYEFDISILRSLFLPLEVSTIATGIGPSDLMSLSRIIFGNDLFMLFNPFLWLIAAIYCIYIFICVFLRPLPQYIIASSILLSMGTMYHLGYDHYMFFIAILIATDSIKRINFSMIFLIFLALFFWLGDRALKILSLEAKVYWSMDMGVIFTSIMVTIILVSMTMILKNRKLND